MQRYSEGVMRGHESDSLSGWPIECGVPLPLTGCHSWPERLPYYAGPNTSRRPKPSHHR
jgi:hypothetical protein